MNHRQKHYNYRYYSQISDMECAHFTDKKNCWGNKHNYDVVKGTT